MMRVWIHNPFDNLPEEGYRKQRYRLMTEAFERAGHEVLLWTSSFSHANKAPRKFERPLSDNVRLIPTPRYAKNISPRRLLSHLVYACRWYRLGLSEINRPDLIVSSIPTISGAVAALLLARHFSVKSVIDLQDAWPETFERIVPRWMLAPLRWAARWVYRRASLVTGVCDRYRELVGRGDYCRAYLGIEFSAGNRTEPPGCTRYVYAGAMGRSYDLTPWIRRVESDESLTLDIAANGRVMTECPRIRQHGYLARGKLRKLLRECDVGIIPMSADSWVGIPNKFFDYAEAGLRIETTLEGECSYLAARWNEAMDRKAPLAEVQGELDAVKIYDRYVRLTTTGTN